MAVAVIGDVHGMIDPFLDLIAQIDNAAPQAAIVCVGDLVDRGEASAAVLRHAHACRDRLTVLRGNHEDMLIGFLDAPAQEGPRWLNCGGLQTLASFGIGGLGPASGGARMEAAAAQLRAAIGPEIEAWLRALPRLWRSGTLVVTHAGADPLRPIEAQTESALSWGHPEFGRRARLDGLWIAHGHTIVADPVCADGIISVDTGAFSGGGLTAALICPGNLRFLRVRS
ncbi:metallophosphoesterase [Rhodobacter lacus]